MHRTPPDLPCPIGGKWPQSMWHEQTRYLVCFWMFNSNFQMFTVDAMEDSSAKDWPPTGTRNNPEQIRTGKQTPSVHFCKPPRRCPSETSSSQGSQRLGTKDMFSICRKERSKVLHSFLIRMFGTGGFIPFSFCTLQCHRLSAVTSKRSPGLPHLWSSYTHSWRCPLQTAWSWHMQLHAWVRATWYPKC